MTYEIYHLIFVIAAVMSGIFLVAAGILYWRLNISGVIGNLTGTTAKKAIKSIKEKNKQSSGWRYQPISVNKQGGSITEKISTDSLQMQAEETSVLGTDTEATTVLTESMFSHMIFRVEQDITFIHTEEIITM